MSSRTDPNAPADTARHRPRSRRFVVSFATPGGHQGLQTEVLGDRNKHLRYTRIIPPNGRLRPTLATLRAVQYADNTARQLVAVGISARSTAALGIHGRLPDLFCDPGSPGHLRKGVLSAATREGLNGKVESATLTQLIVIIRTGGLASQATSDEAYKPTLAKSASGTG